MYYLVVAVVVLGVATMFNLLLTFGLIRRLKDQDKANAHRAEVTVPVGQRIGDFSAQTTKGATTSRDGAVGQRIVGFFSPGCEPCEERIPEFLAYAQRRALAALAIVVADDGGGQPYVDRLSPSADVVIEPPAGPVAAAFGVEAFPTLCLIAADGTVLACGNVITELPGGLPQRVRA
jgi:thiol-disulfide isomerase/thioredoxin